MGASATGENAGAVSAYSGGYAVPDALDQALGISTNAHVDKTALTAYQSASAAVKVLQKQALQANATATEILNAAKEKVPGFLAAMQVTAQNGGTAMDVALTATQELTDQLIDLWPDVFNLVAANPGAWGNRLTVSSNTNGITLQVAQSINPALTVKDLFNLQVTYQTPSGGTMSETFQNVTVAQNGGAQRLDKVLAAQSILIALPLDTNGNVELPSAPPDPNSSGTGTGGNDSCELSLTTMLGNAAEKSGIYALDKIKSFNILCIPPDQRDLASGGYGDTPPLIYQTAAEYCTTRYAMLIIDPPGKWYDEYQEGNLAAVTLNDLGSFGAMAEALPSISRALWRLIPI